MDEQEIINGLEQELREARQMIDKLSYIIFHVKQGNYEPLDEVDINQNY